METNIEYLSPQRIYNIAWHKMSLKIANSERWYNESSQCPTQLNEISFMYDYLFGATPYRHCLPDYILGASCII